jgi:hypothetical protein
LCQPLPTAWRALTDPAGLAGWWSTKLDTTRVAVGTRLHWTFGGDFNPVMEITRLDQNRLLEWRCVAGHTNWNDNVFRFELAPLNASRVRLRFWQDYAVELADDDYGIYNFNWGYYLESLRLYCETGIGKPFEARQHSNARAVARRLVDDVFN